MQQNSLNSLRALQAVGGIALVESRYVDACGSLVDAIWLSMSPQITHRQRSHDDYAQSMGMNKSNFSKKVNGANLPQDFLLRLANVTGNALPIQWLAKQAGYEMIPARKSRIQELRAELAELERAMGATGDKSAFI